MTDRDEQLARARELRDILLERRRQRGEEAKSRPTKASRRTRTRAQDPEPTQTPVAQPTPPKNADALLALTPEDISKFPPEERVRLITKRERELHRRQKAAFEREPAGGAWTNWAPGPYPEGRPSARDSYVHQGDKR